MWTSGCWNCGSALGADRGACCNHCGAPGQRPPYRPLLALVACIGIVVTLFVIAVDHSLTPPSEQRPAVTVSQSLSDTQASKARVAD